MPTGDLGVASFQLQSSNRKLAPQFINVLSDGRIRNEPTGPRCSSTYVSITATCPSSCAWKDNGCYVQAGGGRWAMGKLDRAAKASKHEALAVMHDEASLIENAWRGRVRQDGARGGRDLRLHVGGDVSCADGATVLAAAVDCWYSKGGGAAWTFTHRWSEVPIHRWGEINVLASVERVAECEAAIEAGYTPAIVVERHDSPKAKSVGALRVVPCPSQTRGRTCVECRLCVDAELPKGTVIAFAAHGIFDNRVLQQLRLGRAGRE